MHKKKLILIWPKGGDTFPRLGKKIVFFYPLNLPIIAALTPQDYDVTIVDEHTESLDFNIAADLVAINVLTHNAPRAYAIAQQFRRRNIKVVLGGVHVNLVPEEASEHADAIIIGQVENIWRNLLNDFEENGLKKMYEGAPISQEQYVIPDRSLITGKNYFNIPTIEATRGCPNFCRFCAVAANYKTSYMCRNVDDVIGEIDSFNNKFFLFLDDNLTANKEYAKSLFSKLATHDSRWGGQVSLDTAKDDNLLKLMRKSGCEYVFIGLETISEKNLRQNRKLCNLQNYEQAIRKFHDHGIAIYGSFIFGLDHDDETVFERTVDFARNNNIDVAAFSIFTPLPGTKVFFKMLEDRRIFNFDWSMYDFRHVVYKPLNMSPSKLQEGYHWAWRQFYSPSSIAKRFHNIKSKKLTLPINFAYFIQTRMGWKKHVFAAPLGMQESHKANEEVRALIGG